MSGPAVPERALAFPALRRRDVPPADRVRAVCVREDLVALFEDLAAAVHVGDSRRAVHAFLPLLKVACDAERRR